MSPQPAANAWPLTAFSPDGLQLAVASSDGRLKTYDTGSGRIVLNIAEDGRPAAERHAAVEVANPVFEQHTALTWVSTGGTAEQLLVLGTAAGDVKAHSASSGRLLWRATAVSEGGVAAVAWAGAAGALYAAGVDRQLVRLDPAEGAVISRFEAGRHQLSALAVTPDGSRAFAASTAVAAWDPAAQRRLCKFTGHPAAARSIAVTADGQYATSIAAGERHVAVWQATGDPSKKTRSAAGVLSLEHAAVSVAMRAEAGGSGDGDGGGLTGRFFVAAVSVAAELYVWRCTPAAGAERRVVSELLARVTVGASREERGGDDGILAAQLTGSCVGGGAEVQVARSSWALPTFQRLSLPAGAASTSIVLPPQQGGILLPHDASGAAPADGGRAGGAAAQQQQQQAQPFMLGPDNAEQPLQLRGRTANGAAEPADAARRKRRHPGDADEAGEGDEAFLDAQGFGEAPLLGNGLPDGGAAAAAYGSSEDEDASDAEPTLGERVAALQLEEQKRAAVQAGIAVEDADEDSRGAGEAEAEAPLKAIKADSLAVLLTQALRSEDKALLDRCLAVGSPDVITNTVSRLQAPDAALLLRAGVARLQSHPRRGRQLAAWLQALVAAHTAYFIAAPGARTALTALYQCIEARLANRQALTSLQGRLELLAAQPQPGSGAAPAANLLKPQVVYLAGDSTDDEQLGSGSEDDDDMSADGQLGSEGWGTDEDDDSEEDDFMV